MTRLVARGLIPFSPYKNSGILQNKAIHLVFKVMTALKSVKYLAYSAAASSRF
jgi:hypothetical protein